MEKFIGFEQAYIETLKEIRKNGISISPRGNGTRELVGHGFEIEFPNDRIISSTTRKVNPFYLVGNLLWVLSQSNDLEFINYYNPRGSNFSDDGKILRGAYGKRIFDMDGVNQLHQAIRELKLDKDSRRALVNIHMAQHDWTGSLDTPCTSDFQLLIRPNPIDNEDELIMINHMRSQSAAFVMPYDIFLMTMIQEIIANELEVKVGPFKHFCNSIHFYDREANAVDEIIEEYSNPENKEALMMPKINSKLQDFKPLLQFEKDLRNFIINNNKRIDTDTWIAWRNKLDDLSPVLKQIGLILIAKAIDYNFDAGNIEKSWIEGQMEQYFKQLF